ncbi:mannosyl-oligosaccharide alpha-12-mannosidase [Fusarium albosuccineum]|uniref:alpha-1,2-Mannosidase n=1 Tax=Fusarium albosuccineum TaxID=1237068 RepID=A0A8H4LB60_9HYPO|nr:mannosyl-oligosaccharide alpha-12-mannosidase [Fusarium albosuccineum]
MLPLRRRGRFYTIVSVFMVFMLYRFLQNSWSQSARYDPVQPPPNPPAGQPVPGDGSTEAFEPPVAPPPVNLPDSSDQKPDSIVDAPKPVVPQEDGNLPGKVDDGEDKTIPEKPANEPVQVDAPIQDKVDTPVQEKVGDQVGAVPEDKTEDVKKPADESPPQIPPVQFKDPPMPADNPDRPAVNVDGSNVHWTKPKENFPVPAESIIPIPTGTAPDINRIQFDFQPEDQNTIRVRMDRRNRVKAELVRAWAGYRKYALGHDELLPLSLKYRDTFNGWGATLVDSLDTLWIAGMKEEFDEAVNVVAKIDFTYTDRNDIPVFETTIRYLGGLIAAYDLTGGPSGNYKVLLDKSVELAEILMGVFDTPNRMPLLHYRWRPPYSSQPHRASTVGIAELATLSMEFTRLAQITGNDKYYDAVARITNALVKMQEDGTDIPGLFPERIDASGCNKTAATLKSTLSEEAQKQVDADDLTKQPEGYNPGTASQQGTDEFTPAQLPQADSRWEDKLRRRDAPPPLGDPFRMEDQAQAKPAADQPPPLAADGSTTQWDCEPQGLTAGSRSYGVFHMGGAQDSAYEYFPKQYLLLNGLEPKYRKLYEDTIDAVNEWLLYRPMIKEDGWDVFFTGKMTTSSKGDSEWSKTYEMAHLACFIGGMYGLGGKIFGRDGDIDKAKKLTDGCVWAYQSTPTGLMPEYAHLVACPALEKCPFNETTWYEDLDPSMEWRANELAKWEEGEAQRKLTEKAAPEAARAADPEPLIPGANTDKAIQKPAEQVPRKVDDPSTGSEPAIKVDDAVAAAAAAPVAAAGAAGEGLSKPVKRAGIPMPELDRSMEEDDSEFGSELPDSLKQKIGLNTKAEAEAEKAEEKAEAEKKPVSGQETTEKPSVPDSFDHRQAEQVAAPSNQPAEKPMSHEEFVKARLEREKLPPGYTDIINRSYILRPEAIESVWYMYRITGDATWQDKGWKMFQATVAATRTEFANSAIDDVLDNSEPGLKDEMESFWISETLKYYYLLFSEPELISLDEWVLNTEAHPFRRPAAQSA